MILRNPTDKFLAVRIFGTEYTIEPGGKSVDMPEASARYWSEVLHKFLTIEREVKEVDKVKEVKVAKEVTPK